MPDLTNGHNDLATEQIENGVKRVDKGSFLMACHECDQLHQIRMLPPRGILRCARCGAKLYHSKVDSVDRTLALAIAGTILFIIANTYPFLGFRIGAQIRHSNLATGVFELYHQDMWILASLVLLTTILVPAFQLAGMLCVMLPIRFNRAADKHMIACRFIKRVQPWSMLEVFMLGILVAIVKLAKMATIIPGPALYAFMALIFVLAAMMASFDPHVIWKHKEGHQ